MANSTTTTAQAALERIARARKTQDKAHVEREALNVLVDRVLYSSSSSSTTSARPMEREGNYGEGNTAQKIMDLRAGKWKRERGFESKGKGVQSSTRMRSDRTGTLHWRQGGQRLLWTRGGSKGSASSGGEGEEGEIVRLFDFSHQQQEQHGSSTSSSSSSSSEGGSARGCVVDAAWVWMDVGPTWDEALPGKLSSSREEAGSSAKDVVKIARTQGPEQVTSSLQRLFRASAASSAQSTTPSSRKKEKHTRRRRALCILVGDMLVLHMPHSGEEYTRKLDLRPARLFSLDGGLDNGDGIGLFMQRQAEAGDSSSNNGENGEPLSTLFYLRRPFDDLHPVDVVRALVQDIDSKSKTTAKKLMRPFNRIDEQVIFVAAGDASVATSWLVAIDRGRGKVTVYAYVHDRAPIPCEELVEEDDEMGSSVQKGSSSMRPAMSSRTPSHSRTPSIARQQQQQQHQQSQQRRRSSRLMDSSNAEDLGGMRRRSARFSVAATPRHPSSSSSSSSSVVTSALTSTAQRPHRPPAQTPGRMALSNDATMAAAATAASLGAARGPNGGSTAIGDAATDSADMEAMLHVFEELDAGRSASSPGRPSRTTRQRPRSSSQLQQQQRRPTLINGAAAESNEANSSSSPLVNTAAATAPATATRRRVSVMERLSSGGSVRRPTREEDGGEEVGHVSRILDLPSQLHSQQPFSSSEQQQQHQRRLSSRRSAFVGPDPMSMSAEAGAADTAVVPGLACFHQFAQGFAYLALLAEIPLTSSNRGNDNMLDDETEAEEEDNVEAFTSRDGEVLYILQKQSGVLQRKRAGYVDEQGSQRRTITLQDEEGGPMHGIWQAKSIGARARKDMLIVYDEAKAGSDGAAKLCLSLDQGALLDLAGLYDTFDIDWRTAQITTTRTGGDDNDERGESGLEVVHIFDGASGKRYRLELPLEPRCRLSRLVIDACLLAHDQSASSNKVRQAWFLKRSSTTPQLRRISDWDIVVDVVLDLNTTEDHGAVKRLLYLLERLAQDARLETVAGHDDVPRLARLITRLAQRHGHAHVIDYWARLAPSCWLPCAVTAETDYDAVNDIYQIAKQLVNGVAVRDEDLDDQRIQRLLLRTKRLFQVLAAFAEQDQHQHDQARDRRVVDAMLDVGFDAPGEMDRIPLPLAQPLLDAMERCRRAGPGGWTSRAYAFIGRADLARQMDTAQGLVGLRLEQASSPVKNGHGKAAAAAAASSTSWLYPLDPLCSTIFAQDARLRDVTEMLQSARPVTVTSPATANTSDNGGVTEDQAVEMQRALLLTVTERIKATPLGRGLLTVGSKPFQPWLRFPVERVCMAVRMLGNVVVSHREPESESAEMEWPEFHSGVASGLSICLEPSDNVESGWIFGNSAMAGSTATSSSATSASSGAMTARHAGFILGLGLMGHLRHLGRIHAFRYLKERHEPTSIALLVGLGASFLGTRDLVARTLLSMHLQVALPRESVPLRTTMLTQSAALVGLGLLHTATDDAWAARTALKALSARRVTTDDSQMVARECYCLCAGFALGLTMLVSGKRRMQWRQSSGSTTTTTTSTELERDVVMQLELLMTRRATHLAGDEDDFDEETDDEGESSEEGDEDDEEEDEISPHEWRPDASITEVPALIALALIFLRSGRRDVADKVVMPRNSRELDDIRPDVLLARVLARSLIMLEEEVRPTQEWLDGCVPAFLKFNPTTKRKGGGLGIPPQSHQLALYNILGGACFALALKYAGSANEDAVELLKTNQAMLARQLDESPLQGGYFERIKRQTLQTVCDVVTNGLCIVLAGRGSVEVLQVLRKNLYRADPASTTSSSDSSNTAHYARFSASMQALGTLFLGGGRLTFTASDLGIAGLLMAYFPRYPTGAGGNAGASSADQRAYLQACRHLWVLAVEPRLLVVRDVDGGKILEGVSVRIETRSADQTQTKGAMDAQTKICKTPCLLPELSEIVSLQVVDPKKEFWSHGVTLHGGDGTKDEAARAFASTRTLYVQRRTVQRSCDDGILLGAGNGNEDESDEEVANSRGATSPAIRQRRMTPAQREKLQTYALSIGQAEGSAPPATILARFKVPRYEVLLALRHLVHHEQAQETSREQLKLMARLALRQMETQTNQDEITVDGDVLDLFIDSWLS